MRTRERSKLRSARKSIASSRNSWPGPQKHPHPPARGFVSRASPRRLIAAEQHLVKSLSAEKGRDLLKQVRSHLIETARPVLEAMVEKITGIKVVTLHHDISTTTGEEVVLFTLAQSPVLREAKMK